jgi:alanyl-tRNA synthetase
LEKSIAVLDKLAQALGTTPAASQDKLAALFNELDTERKTRFAMEKEISLKRAEELLAQVEIINGVRLIAAKVPSIRADSLREMSDVLKGKLGSGIIVLGTVFEDRPSFVAVVTQDLVQKGYHAGDIVKKAAQLTGGGGGGKAGMAQAGGKDASKIDEALQVVRTLIK